MSDNITVDNGVLTDFTVSADEAGSGQVQRVKLSYSGDGLDTHIGADVNGLDVDVTRLPALPAGTNNIGDVDIASAIPAGTNNIGDVDIASMPAAARTTDTISSAGASDVVMNNLTALTPKFAKANVAAATTDGNIVTAVGGKKIRVLVFRLHAGGTATTVTFNSKPAGAGTAVSETFALGINGSHHGSYCVVGHFETTTGEGLTVTTGAGATTGIGVVYVEV